MEPLRLPEPDSPPLGVNLAPMVDILFNLLIFFFLTASFLVPGSLRVSLPAARGESLRSAVAVVEVDREGFVWWKGERRRPEALEARWFEGSREIVVAADRGAPVGALVRVLEVLREAGQARLRILVRAG